MNEWKKEKVWACLVVVNMCCKREVERGRCRRMEMDDGEEGRGARSRGRQLKGAKKDILFSYRCDKLTVIQTDTYSRDETTSEQA